MKDKIMTEYVDHMKNEKNLTLNTLEAYTRDIKLFKEYLLNNEIDKLKNANKTLIITYLMSLQKKGRATSTISRNLASIRSFYQYLLNNNIISEDPTLNLKAPKIEKKIPDILTIKEINQLLAQPNANDFKGARDKAMLELLYATGLKVSEIISLNINSLDLDIGIVSVEDPNNIKRIIPIGRMSIDSLIYYIETYRKDEDTGNPLFINYSGNRLTRQGFWKILKQYTKQSNLQKTITPHTLRHSFAVHLIENGADLKTVQEILGHSELSTTQVYAFASMSEDKNIREVYKKTHPRA